MQVPPFEIPAVTTPAKEIPAREIPLPAIPPVCIGEVCTKPPTMPVITIPAISVPGVTIPAITIPGYSIPERCFDTETTNVLPPSQTTVRIRNYHVVDSQFSLALSIAYWRQTGNSSSVPDHDAKGFGELNKAGLAKNQYVRPYFRVDGTFVPGFWRHGRADGRPTCKIIRC